jgi:chaperone required for assembly of F1-ATPase
MTGWAPRRFWQHASAQPVAGAGWGVRLDQRDLRTPAKAPLIVPTRALAEALAAEWDAQGAEVRPASMPLTRMANSALDKVTPQIGAVRAEVAGYGASDLLCYRAEGPPDLVARQVAGWDPLLDWAEGTLGARLGITTGIVHVAQPRSALARLRAEVAGFGAFSLAGLHDLVAISGSLVIGLAVARGHLAPDQGFALSRLDERWQAEVWGMDPEAAAAEAEKQSAFATAARFLSLCG